MTEILPRAGRAPLYAQVYDILVERIASGRWRPGDPLPSEFELARELGVSQGTVRKALDRMAGEHLLMRRQGRGTFVAEHTAEAMHFRFFQMHDAKGLRAIPDSVAISVERVTANARERAALELVEGSEVVRIRRIRTVGEEPVILEDITLPAARFEGIETIEPIPNTLYDLFQSGYGITVAAADEKLTAERAGAREARRLGVEPGEALLVIDRVATGVDGAPVEWRVSRCLTGRLHYLSRLR